VINRNLLVGLIVLLAGAVTGYLASLGASRFHDHLLSEFPDAFMNRALDEPSIASLSTIYDHSRIQDPDSVISAPGGSLSFLVHLV